MKGALLFLALATPHFSATSCSGVQAMQRTIKPGSFYQHYKGKYYYVLGEAQAPTLPERVTVYQALYTTIGFGDYPLWVRPAEMFAEKIELEGKERYRFEEVTDREVIKKLTQDYKPYLALDLSKPNRPTELVALGKAFYSEDPQVSLNVYVHNQTLELK